MPRKDDRRRLQQSSLHTEPRSHIRDPQEPAALRLQGAWPLPPPKAAAESHLLCFTQEEKGCEPLTFTGMATSHNTHKKEKTRSVGEDVEKSEPWCVAGGNKK